MSENLKECPFCGWPDPSWHVERYAYDWSEYAVHCGNCEAESAMALTKEAAAEAWNRRAQSVTPAPDWSQAPKWAQWWAVSADGCVNWFEVEPQMMAGFGE